MLITECCFKRIDPQDRYCPGCGWEARVLLPEEAGRPAPASPAPGPRLFPE